jgi:type III pantothenate kinase
VLLAIDAGNTNIVFAIYDGQEQIEQCRMETDGKIPETINEIGQKYPQIDAAIISSVVPNVNDMLEKACTYLLKAETLVVNYENARVKISSNIPCPEEIGADRLVDAVAVLTHYQSPAIIVDFGTATTFDVIDAEGQYCGGVIAPGINLSLRALHMAAAKLPSVDVAKPEKVIGLNTEEAMQSGIYWGYIGLIEGTIKRIAAEMDAKPFIIATGGLAPLFDQGTEIIDVIDSDLIMKGLVHIHAQRNQDENRKNGT